ncbi:MAG TPA: response regulator transcription factor [Terracidiphilus sp.]|nr:response regulator transcription factor [Terracidiphilus sp.]
MSTSTSPNAIRIGVVADEPIRTAGLASIFDQPAQQGQPQLVPIVARMDDLLADSTLEYLVIDLHAALGSLETLESIRQIRPNIRLIVIGPEGDDELVLSSIVAGARGFLDLTAGPDVVRKAVEVVTSGSIWAPRRLLSKLIDRLLKVPDAAPQVAGPQLTSREQQVLKLILMARSNREIAEQLGIEERTVKAYVGRLMRKTGADNRIKLSMSALNRSLVPSESILPNRDSGEHRKNSTN